MFVDYCYVITRHIQDGALQVTKKATFKVLLSHFNRELDKTAIIFEFLGKSFRNLGAHYMSRAGPVRQAKLASQAGSSHVIPGLKLIPGNLTSPADRAGPAHVISPLEKHFLDHTFPLS